MPSTSAPGSTRRRENDRVREGGAEGAVSEKTRVEEEALDALLAWCPDSRSYGWATGEWRHLGECIVALRREREPKPKQVACTNRIVDRSTGRLIPIGDVADLLNAAESVRRNDRWLRGVRRD